MNRERDILHTPIVPSGRRRFRFCVPLVYMDKYMGRIRHLWNHITIVGLIHRVTMRRL
jgi:hypothetical protein